MINWLKSILGITALEAELKKTKDELVSYQNANDESHGNIKDTTKFSLDK